MGPKNTTCIIIFVAPFSLLCICDACTTISFLSETAGHSRMGPGALVRSKKDGSETWWCKASSKGYIVKKDASLLHTVCILLFYIKDVQPEGFTPLHCTGPIFRNAMHQRLYIFDVKQKNANGVERDEGKMGPKKRYVRRVCICDAKGGACETLVRSKENKGARA